MSIYHIVIKKKRYMWTDITCNYGVTVECLEGAVAMFWLPSPVRRSDWLMKCQMTTKEAAVRDTFSDKMCQCRCVFLWARRLGACRQEDVTGSERHGGASAAGYIKQADDYITVRRLMASPFFFFYGFAAAEPPFPFQFNPIHFVIHSGWGVLPLLHPHL